MQPTDKAKDLDFGHKDQGKDQELTSLKVSKSFTCILAYLSANGMNHAFASPAKAGPHFTSPEAMEGCQFSWLVTWLTHPQMVAHPSTNII